MSMIIAAKFVNGVFVPEERPPLPENQRVQLVVRASNPPRDVDADLAAVRAQAQNRLVVDSNVGHAIAQDPVFNIENW